MKQATKSEIIEILSKAKKIAVVGLSDQPDRTSYQVAKVLQQKGYDIIPVNPTIESSLGVKAVSNLSEIKEHVDIVNVFRRSEFLPEVAKEASKIDADVFWAQLGLQSDEAQSIAEEAGMKVVMDRCIKIELMNN